MNPAPSRRVRRAARILLIDEADRLLLFRFTPPGRAPFWCGAGGECDPGESFPDAARRELYEETGLDIDCGAEIAVRSDEYLTLLGEPIVSDEHFFRVRVPAFAIDTTRHTELERAMMSGHRWFTQAELANWHEDVFPDNILAILDTEIDA